MFPVILTGDHQVRMIYFAHSAAHSTSKLKTIISTLLFAKMIMFTEGWLRWRIRTWGGVIRTPCLTEHHFNRPQVGWRSGMQNIHQLPLWKAILNNSSTPLSFNHKIWSLGRYHGMKIMHSLPERLQIRPQFSCKLNQYHFWTSNGCHLRSFFWLVSF